MQRTGLVLFAAGLGISAISGLILSLDLGFFCRLDAGPPETLLSYRALCFIAWAYSVPLGLILAATGTLLLAGTTGRHALTFLAGMMAVFLFITFANGPMPHVPPLFGIGGALILLFYALILWTNRTRFAESAYSLAGYTFLVIGLWWVCGLAGAKYHPALESGESPIDIMVYFVLAMGFFWLGERRRARSASHWPDHPHLAP